MTPWFDEESKMPQPLTLVEQVACTRCGAAAGEPCINVNHSHPPRKIRGHHGARHSGAKLVNNMRLTLA